MALFSMNDLQKTTKPNFEIAINKVGITNLMLPMNIRYGGKLNPVTAKIDAFVDLPKEERGTHMSRMIRILNKYSEREIDTKQISNILQEMKEQLNARHSYLNMEFTLFKMKEAPVTKNPGYIGYNCFLRADQNSILKIRLGAKVLVTSLCPISKDISDYSAHNQRGELKAEVLCDDGKLWFDDLIDTVEKGGSCELFSVLKREDEKYVTEKAYNNPKIVEDIVREVAALLKDNKHIEEFKISCENFESIHTHNAFSEIQMKNGR